MFVQIYASENVLMTYVGASSIETPETVDDCCKVAKIRLSDFEWQKLSRFCDSLRTLHYNNYAVCDDVADELGITS